MSIAPWGSAATGRTLASPRPSSRSDRSTVACRSAEATTRTRGEPASPSRSTSQPASCEHPVPTGRQTDGVRRLGPGAEPDGRRRRQAEQLLEPAAGHLLDHARGRRGRRVERQLVPADGEDVRGGGRRQGPADDEPEEARPGVADQPGVGGRDEQVRAPGRARWARAGSGPPSAVRSASRSTGRATGRSASPDRNSIAASAAVRIRSATDPGSSVIGASTHWGGR